MKNLKINISKARVESFNVSFNFNGEDEVPSLAAITANISLLTSDGKKVTSMQVVSQGYYGDTKFKQDQIDKLSFDAYELLGKIEIEAIKSINNIKLFIPQNATKEINWESDETKE